MRNILFASLLLSAGLTTSAAASSECTFNAITVDGDLSQLAVEPTGEATLPCRVSFIPNETGRGRFNHTTVGCDDCLRPAGRGTGATTGWMLEGTAESRRDQEYVQSSIMHLLLADDRRLQVTLTTEGTDRRLSLSTHDPRSGILTELGETSLLKDGWFMLAVQTHPAGSRHQLTVTLANSASSTRFSLREALPANGLDGWRYGLLLAPRVDNRAAYSVLTTSDLQPTRLP